MYQPYSSGGQLAGPLRAFVPAPVRTAVRFMYAGAAVSLVSLIIVLPVVLGDTRGYHLRWNGHRLTAAQISDWRPVIIAVMVVGGLAVPALWLWMARANGRGRNWARVLSTVFFGVATLDLTNLFGTPGGLHLTVAPAAAGWITAVVTWLVGAAAVWLLWRPASSAFFKPQGVVG
jgi:hypothetical protein